MNTNLYRGYILALALSVLAPCAFATEGVPLKLDEATIEIAVDNPSTQLAARELSKHLELLCGKRPKTVRANGRFVLGRGPKGAETPRECESFARFADGVLYFWGDDRSRPDPIQGWGTACGVYGFLEKALGVRWTFPGDDGIVYKPQKSVLLPKDWQYRHWPRLEKNEIRLHATGWGRMYDGAKVPLALRLSPGELEKENADRRLWPLRQRLQTRDYFSFGHAFMDWQQRFLKTHPEYIAMNHDGTRGKPPADAVYAHQCISNPEVQDQMIADWKKAGMPKRFNLCANDSWYHCRCPNCRAWDADLPGEAFQMHKTDRIVHFCNLMTEKAMALRPDVEVCAYAYLDFRYAPRREKVRYPDRLIIAFVPSIYDDFTKIVDEWLAAGLKRFVIRPNYLCYSGFVPRGYERQFYDEFRRFADRGMLGNDEGSFNRDVILNFETYVFARLMAEPDIAFETIENEFLSQYGVAGPEMREYYRRVRARGEKERDERTRTRAYDIEAAVRDDGEFLDNAVGGHSVADMTGDLAVLDRALARPGLTAVERRRIHAVRTHVELAIHARRVWDVFVPWQKNMGDAELVKMAKKESREMLAFACDHADELRDSWPRVIPRPSYVGKLWARFGILDEFLKRQADTETAISDIKVYGYVGRRLDDCLRNNLAAMDTEMLTRVFHRKGETWNWDTEFWGKYMHAAVPLGHYLRSDEFTRRVSKGVADVLAEQLPNGYIGDFLEGYRSNLGWDVWGNKYTLLGLLEYWRDTHDQRALDGARKLGDYVISQFPSKRPLHETGGHRGLASGSILEPFVWLYKATGEKRYLDFAKYVVSELNDAANGPKLIDSALDGIDVAERPTGAPKWYRGGHKAYEMMSCYQGLLEYYEVTGDRRCFEAARKTAENILATEENICGGMSSNEFWYHGSREQIRPCRSLQETCVSTTWMRLCEKLLVLTGDPKWADAIERTFYNAYLASLSADGRVFSTYCPLSGMRHEGQDQCSMRANCCNANGPRGFVALLKAAVTAEGDTVKINQFLPMSVKVSVPAFGDEKLPFLIDTHYPRDGRVSIRYDGIAPRRFTLKLRIPAWADGTKTSFRGIDNGPVKETEHGPVKAGTYYALTRTWDPSETMFLDFDLKVVSHKLDDHVAFTRGPIALARDLRFGDGDLGEALNSDCTFSSDAFDIVESPRADIWITCSARLDIGHHMLNKFVPVKPREIKFCDFASAGNTWDIRSSYRVWMPIEINCEHPLETQGREANLRPGDFRPRVGR